MEPDFKFLLEPEPEWSRVKNLTASAILVQGLEDPESLLVLVFDYFFKSLV